MLGRQPTLATTSAKKWERKPGTRLCWTTYFLLTNSFIFSFVVIRESYRINHLQVFCLIKMVHGMKILEKHGTRRSISHS